MKHTPITSKAKTKFTFSDNMDISMNADGSGGPFKSPNKQMSSTFVKKGVEYKTMPSQPKFKGGTAPVGPNVGRITKAFQNATKQYGKHVPQNMQSFIKQAKQAFKVKSNRNIMSNREKVTGLSDDFFKGVEKSFKNNPKLEKTSSGYYGFKNAKGVGKNLEEVAEQLEGAVKAHGKQAKAVRKHIADMEKMKTPAKQVTGDVKVKDIPKKAVEGAKKLVKKIGDIKISTEEGRKRRQQIKKRKKEERDHNKSARKTEGTRVGQFIRKHTGKNKAQAPEAPAKRKDACYHKVKSRYKKWPSAYASGALAKCRKVGASNWGNKS